MVPDAATHKDAPLTLIRPESGAGFDGVSEVWAHRDLGWLLALRDVQVRYKETALGVSWALLQPLATTGIFTLVLGRSGAGFSEGTPYALNVFSAMSAWTLFSSSLAAGAGSLTGNASLVSKVYFPRLLIPVAASVGSVVDFGVTALFQVLLQLWFGVPFGPTVLLAPAFALGALLLGTAVGVWLAGINVRYRDVRYALPFLVQLWMFCTPVIYSLRGVPEVWQLLFRLNPVVGWVEGYRAAWLGQPLPSSIWLSAALTLVAWLWSVRSFRKMEQHFADFL